ncbi:gamma carbonic anhydrase family protein [Methanobacterium sp.]|uniref:gamma carbonic anhydrase family protein n=1 Tax=Methanobacterium sp. TaxID=2164 RepID=UPI003C78E4D8
MDTVDKSVRTFEGSKIIGNVKIDAESSVWYNAVLRGDIEPITVGKHSNIQDNCVVHSSKDYPVKLGDYVSVGHAAVLHGCEIGDNCLIGMNSTVLNGVKIMKNCMVGAGAVVTEGKEFEEGSLILGTPARAVRKLTDEEIASIKENAVRYTELAKNE